MQVKPIYDAKNNVIEANISKFKMLPTDTVAFREVAQYVYKIERLTIQMILRVCNDNVPTMSAKISKTWTRTVRVKEVENHLNKVSNTIIHHFTTRLHALLRVLRVLATKTNFRFLRNAANSAISKLISELIIGLSKIKNANTHLEARHEADAMWQMSVEGKKMVEALQSWLYKEQMRTYKAPKHTFMSLMYVISN